MKDYYEKNKSGASLGYFVDFEKQLVAIYGQRDTKETAKKEITELWANTSLAQKDFIKYCERYRTLACIVEYEDKLHIDKITNIPAKWEEYLEVLLEIYKELHPEKSKSSIFGTSNTDKDNNGAKNDSANSSKGKGKEANSQQVVAKFCQICSGKGQKGKAKTHNTVDCYDKPGNEHRRPAPKTSTSSSSSSSSSGSKGQKTFKGKKTIMARLAELQAELEQLGDDDGAASPAATITVNSATIEEIVDLTPGETPAIAQVDDVPKGTPRPTGCNTGYRRAQMDFPEGL
ncbi:hypothetical protein EIP86_005813 [Pleurotus ostreatoroseus]|nr:hypothetical protein EIP86_005813 [Pleurotus ostreatoroseus]